MSGKQIAPEETDAPPRQMEVAENSTSQEGKEEELPAKQTDCQPGETKEVKSAMQVRGSQLWLRLQKGFRRAVEKIKNEEMKMAYLSHGLQHLHHITFLHPVRCVIHDSLKNVFVVLDAENNLHLYKEDGFYLSSQRAPVPMTGLLYASQVDHFVAWDKSDLRVLDSSFEVLSEVHSALPIRCVLYSELLNQIVTAGDGNLTVWGFRYKSQNLQCRAMVSEELEPSVVFTRLALDTSGTEPQRCFASCGTGAAAFDISRGALISFNTKLHSRVITDIAYCEAAGSPVTASRDTTIKIWDETWHIRTVFVGHTGPVIALATYPQRPLIFSASQDGTIRTWNLDTVDQVDQVHVSDPVEALETQTASHIASVSGTKLTLWKINKLYSLYAPLGSPVKRLHCTDLEAVASFPVRIVCVCQDASVRLLDAPTGEVLAVLSLQRPVLDVAYCLPRETLFVLTESGSLLRVNAATDPMVVRKSVVSSSEASRPSCLLLYTHMVDPEKAFKTWLDVVAHKSDRKSWQRIPLNVQEKNRYVLIMGQEDGLLSVVDWFSGRIQCQVEAHGSQRVTALAEYSSQTSIISAGADRTVKMWRVFPYADESLVPLLCFSCAVPARHLCCLRETLAVAFQDPETVTYSIVYYNLMEQTRCEHGPEDDPLDDITGLCCCPNLNLFASASRDGSVKIWTSQNRLLRHLKLNTIPESLAFVNTQGDLLVGIERHLYRIYHKKYLPSYYNMTLLCAKFLDPIQDTCLPVSRSFFEQLVQGNVERLKQEPSSEDTGSPLPGSQLLAQESRVRRASQQEKKVPQVPQVPQVLHVPDPGECDLQQLQAGKVRAGKKVRFSKTMREEAFEQYLRVFYKPQPKVEIPEEDAFSADEVLEALSSGTPVSELYGRSMFLGTFPQLASLRAARELLKDATSTMDEGSVTSSIFPATSRSGVRAASAEKHPREQTKLVGMPAPPLPRDRRMLRQPLKRPSEDAPPDAEASFADESRRSSGNLRAPSLGGPFFETIFGIARMPRERFRKELSPIREDESRSPQSTSWMSSLSGSTVLNVVDAASSEKSLSGEEGSREFLRSRRSSLRSRRRMSSTSFMDTSRDRIQAESEAWLLSKVSSGHVPNSVFAQQLLGQESSSSGESMPRAPQPRSLSLSTSSVKAAAQDGEPGREPSREKTSRRSSPKEGSSGVFLTQLDEAPYPEREKSGEAISDFYLRFRSSSWFKHLFPQDLPPGMDIMELLGQLLAAMPTAEYSIKMQLLEAILSLREALGPGLSGMVHTTLLGLLNVKKGAPSMKDFIQQRFILAVLRALLALNKDSRDLMVELMAYYLQASTDPRCEAAWPGPAQGQVSLPARMVVESLMEEMGVQDPSRCFYQEMDSWQVKKDATKKELRKMCSLWLEKAVQELQEHRDLQVLKQKRQGKHTCPFSPKPKGTRWKDTRAVHPVDAINHFIEQQQLAGNIQQPEPPRDTVMALPPIRKRQAILRLGETNAMLRNRIPERFYFPYIFPRYLLKGFVPFVKLALPKIHLSPFLTVPEKPVSPETFTERQQLVQKYFIPKFSYADSYP